MLSSWLYRSEEHPTRKASNSAISPLLDRYQQVVPFFYMGATIATLSFWLAIIFYFGDLSSWSGVAIGLWNLKTILYSLLILVLEKRLKQIEIIRGFVSTYIPHT
jgi:hypothetical protein